MESRYECVCGNDNFSVDKSGKRTCEMCGDETDVINQVGEYKVDNVYGMSKARLKEVGSKSKQWSSFEGFNVILYKWCSTLEKFGVPTSIYDSVFTVWFKYLEECDIFSDNDEKMVYHARDLSFFGIERKSMNIAKNKVATVVDKVANKAAGHGNITFISKQLSRTITDLADDGELVFEVESDEVNENGDECVISEEEKNSNARKSSTAENFKNFFANLTIAKVLALFYLGVRMAEVDVFSCDIIRWCRQGQLPYFSAIQLLEKRQKVDPTDLRIFRQPLICVEKLRRHSGMFAVFISISCVPMPTYSQVWGRFIEQLRLPEDTNQMCQMILQVTGPNVIKKLHLPNIEITAACIVMLAVKIAFGLDDQHETLLSKWAHKINRAKQKTGNSGNFFSFTKWQKFIDKTYWWHDEVAPCSEMTENTNRTHYDSSLIKSHFSSIGAKNFLGLKNSDWTKEIINSLNKLTDTQPVEEFISNENLFCPFNPTTGLFSQYLNNGAINTAPQHLRKAAIDLESTSFKDNIFHWILRTDDIERVLSINNAPHEVTLGSLAFGEVIERNNNVPESLRQKTVKLLLPDPKLSYWQTEQSNSIVSMHGKNMPRNFCWLVTLFAQLCETSELKLLQRFHRLEQLYCVNAKV